MLNVEKFLLLSLNHRVPGTEPLMRNGRIAATLFDLEEQGLVKFMPADLAEPWDLTNPLIHVVPEAIPNHRGLNKVAEKLGKVHNKRLASVFSKPGLDPEKRLLAELARDGVLTQDSHGDYQLVSQETVTQIADEFGLMLRRQKDGSDSAVVLLSIIETLNATARFLGTELPEASAEELSKRANEHTSHHPVVSALQLATDSTGGLMKKSLLSVR